MFLVWRALGLNPGLPDHWHRNIWNHKTVCKLFVFNSNTWHHITVSKQMFIDNFLKSIIEKKCNGTFTNESNFGIKNPWRVDMSLDKLNQTFLCPIFSFSLLVYFSHFFLFFFVSIRTKYSKMNQISELNNPLEVAMQLMIFDSFTVWNKRDR